MRTWIFGTRQDQPDLGPQPLGVSITEWSCATDGIVTETRSQTSPGPFRRFRGGCKLDRYHGSSWRDISVSAELWELGAEKDPSQVEGAQAVALPMSLASCGGRQQSCFYRIPLGQYTRDGDMAPAPARCDARWSGRSGEVRYHPGARAPPDILENSGLLGQVRPTRKQGSSMI